MPPARPVCQPIVKSQLRTWWLSSAGRKLRHHRRQPVVCVSGVTFPQHNQPVLVHLVSLEKYWDVECFKAAEHAGASARFTPDSRMGTSRVVSWFPPLMKCSRRLAAPTKKETSFTSPLGIQVCRHGSEGGGHCFVDISSPPAALSLFSGPMDGAWCGWLELRAMSVAGGSLSCCVFTAHGPCPHTVIR